MTGPEIAQQWPAEYDAWRSWKGHAVDGESPVEVATRARSVVDDWLPSLQQDASLLLVTHGGTARGLVGSLTELPWTHWWRLAPLGNTCWSTLVEDRGQWRLERHNTGLGPLLGAPTGAA
jgi:broad specificity phosphatase PhoE